jgi:hypothetical protein
MDEEKVLQIFKENEIRLHLEDEKIFAIEANRDNYINWFLEDEVITLDGDFTIEILEALIWFMKNKKEFK